MALVGSDEEAARAGVLVSSPISRRGKDGRAGMFFFSLSSLSWLVCLSLSTETLVGAQSTGLADGMCISQLSAGDNKTERHKRGERKSREGDRNES